MSKEATCNAGDAGDMGLIPGSGRSPGGGHSNPTAVFLPRESHGQRSLEGMVLGVTKSRIQLKRLSTAQTSAVDLNVLMDVSSNSFFNGQVISPISGT